VATSQTITFSELRGTTNRIILIVSEVTGYEKEKIGLRTSINDTIGVDGDDWDDILIALQKREGLTLEGLYFYDYFQDESQIAFGAFDIFTLPIRFLFYLISFAWVREKFKTNFDLGTHLKSDLTIGDLVTSKIEGRFVKREERTFKLLSHN